MTPGRRRSLPASMMKNFCAALLAPFLLCGHAFASSAPRPNIVFILADDLGYSDLNCYGSEIQTPTLDKLAADGLRFTQFYNTGRCWPSRACLLSGYYAQQVNRDPPGQRPKWAALLPELLKPAGYHSYHSGKWHVDGPVLAGGFEHSYHVADQDRHFAPRSHFLDDAPLPQPKPEDRYYATPVIAEHALQWLSLHEKEHKDAPFFLYLAFTVPHFPIMAPEEDIARYKDRFAQGWDAERDARLKKMKQIGLVSCPLSPLEPAVIPGWNKSEAELKTAIGDKEIAHAVPWKDLTTPQQDFQSAKMAVHAAMIDRMDREIGRVVEKLKAMGAFENTLILFASDNGASAEQMIRGDGHDIASTPGSAQSYLGIGPGWSSASNTPLRRHKSWNHEGGISTPLIVQWPAGIKARGELRNTPGHLVDIVPTLLELAGAPAPLQWGGEARPPLAGRSLAPAFEKDQTISRECIFFKHEGNRALRAGDWKIAAAGPDSPWELYNLATDRSETRNLATSHPEKTDELAALWKAHDEEFAKQGATGAPLPKRGKNAAGAAKAE
jgi:arylsulfatase A-like enzyme